MAVQHSKDLPGQDGMGIVEYIGGNSGDVTWHGQVTGTQYILGGVRRKGYVDKRDLPGFVSLKKRGQRLFVEIEPIEEPEIKTEIPSINGLANKPVSAVKKALPDLTEAQLDTLLKSEKSGKNRVSAISAIEAQLERVA